MIPRRICYKVLIFIILLFFHNLNVNADVLDLGPCELPIKGPQPTPMTESHEVKKVDVKIIEVSDTQFYEKTYFSWTKQERYINILVENNFKARICPQTRMFYRKPDGGLNVVPGDSITKYWLEDIAFKKKFTVDLEGSIKKGDTLEIAVITINDP